MELQKTNQQTTSTALWKDSNADTVALLREAKFDTIAKSVPNKVSELLDCEPIESLIRNAGQQTVQAFIEAELIKLASMFNGNAALNLKDYQVPIIAEHLMESYKWESIEDFTLCFRRGACGYYDDKLLRIDAAVIGNWMRMYLDEKYDALEQRKAKEKKETKAVDLLKLTQEGEKKFGKDSEYYKEAERIAQSMMGKNDIPTNNAKENELQRKKLENQYKYFTVRGIQIMATSQEHAEALIQRLIDIGDLIEG